MSEQISEREAAWVAAGSPYYRCPVCEAGDVDPFTCEGEVVPGDPPHRKRRAKCVERHGQVVADAPPHWKVEWAEHLLRWQLYERGRGTFHAWAWHHVADCGTPDECWRIADAIGPVQPRPEPSETSPAPGGRQSSKAGSVGVPEEGER